MAFQVSPGVNVTERDLSTIVPSTATTEGAIAGVFRWGPVYSPVLVTDEVDLTNRFGKPSNFNAETFFTAADFLSYGNKLYVVRVANTADSCTDVCAISALANTGAVANAYTYTVQNEDDYLSKTFTDADLLFVAKFPGALGNSLKVSIVDSANAYQKTLYLAPDGNTAQNTSTGYTLSTGSNTANVFVAPADPTSTNMVANCVTIATAVSSGITVGDLITVGNTSTGTQTMKVSNVGTPATAASNTVWFALQFEDTFKQSSNVVYSANATNLGSITRTWEYSSVVEGAPLQSDYQLNFGNSSINDSLHVVVVDEDGAFSGIPGTVLEVFKNVSRATDAKLDDGSNNYYKNILNQRSQYLWFANDRSGAASNTANNLTASTNETPLSKSFDGGSDGADETNVALGVVVSGYDKFKSAEDVDVSLVLQGKAIGGANKQALANYIIDNVVESRRDCVAFISPDKADVANVLFTDTMLNNVLGYRNSLSSTSYAVMDSGYKYRYDKYNDVYRWTPLNGDIAGLCVRTDEKTDPWYSPAGFNRGIIKNVVKLAFNPNKAQRDQLYKANVNPVVTMPGQGTLLYGDKTLQTKPSAFDRINVRRLFIVLEKSIALAAKYALFEFNDEGTRSRFVSMVEPFLRTVQGRRGIYDYRVICDSTNNTAEVIDRNEFVGDIYIKPARSINFIQLNFVAVRTGVEFSEIVGNF